MTPITTIGHYSDCCVFIKRDDLIPFSFGGNKVRKAIGFFDEIDAGAYDCVVTYGSSSSNHCRIVANLSAMRGLPCDIISPEETSVDTYNRKFMELFCANITVVPVAQVRQQIDDTMMRLRQSGKRPYFIPGGGHGIIGTHAYVQCYEEIRQWEKENNCHFSRIYLASGTGTTQAGLICGQLMTGDERTIIGISIARRLPYGRDVIVSSVQEYLKYHHMVIPMEAVQRSTVFLDDYIGNGYGSTNELINRTILESMIQSGIPLDHTYTGKAFYGMTSHLRCSKLKGENILFLHTGGTPLFFDDMNQINGGVMCEYFTSKCRNA